MISSVDDQNSFSLTDLNSSNSANDKDNCKDDILLSSIFNSPTVSSKNDNINFAFSLTESFEKNTNYNISFDDSSIINTKDFQNSKTKDSYQNKNSAKDTKKMLELSSPSKLRSKTTSNPQSSNHHILQRMKIKEKLLEKEVDKWKGKYDDQLSRRNKLVIENKIQCSELERIRKRLNIFEKQLKDSQIKVQRKEMELQTSKKYINHLEQYISTHHAKQSKVSATFEMKIQPPKKINNDMDQKKAVNLACASSPLEYEKENRYTKDSHLPNRTINTIERSNACEEKVKPLHISKNSRTDTPIAVSDIDTFIQEEIDKLRVDDFIDI